MERGALFTKIGTHLCLQVTTTFGEQYCEKPWCKNGLGVMTIIGSPYHVRVDTMEIPKGVSGRGRP